MKTRPAIVRLKRRSQFLFVAKGEVDRRKSCVIQVRAVPGQDGLAAGFTATKKVGNAVVRNRSKRRLREACRALLPELGAPGHAYVFIARQETAGIGWDRLLDDVRAALIRLRAITDNNSRAGEAREGQASGNSE